MATHPKERYTGSDASIANMRVHNFNGKSIYLGSLPDDFLRVDYVEQRSRIQIDEELAASLQHKYDQQARRVWSPQYKAQLIITFVEARLTKNYGLINMNPYIRLQIGHTIYETKTNNKGGKNPKWNELLNCYLPNGVSTLSIQIFDECLLTPDELIAWATFKLPEHYFSPENASTTFEENIILSGKQGDNLEGSLFVVFNVKPITASTVAPVAQSVIYQMPTVFQGTAMPPYSRPIIIQRPDSANALLTGAQPVIIREEDVKALHEMFPSIEIDVIKSVLAAERGNLDRAINNCLELSSTT